MLQQQKKTDFNSIIGLVLIGLVLFWFTFNQSKLEDAQIAEEPLKNSEQQVDAPASVQYEETSFELSDSLASQQLQDKFGAFALAASAVDNGAKFYLENDFIRVELASKSARITNVISKEYQTYDSLPVEFLREDSSLFNLTFWAQNRRLQTKDFVFTSNQYQLDGTDYISFKLPVSEGQYLEYLYSLAPNSYLVDYTVNTVGLSGILQSNSPFIMDWSVNIPRKEKNKENEAMNTSAYYFSDDEVDYLSVTSDDSEKIMKPTWLAFKSQYFSQVLNAKGLFKEVDLSTEAHASSENYLKTISAHTELAYNTGDKSYAMEWLFVPNNVKTLKKYGNAYEDLVPLGWSIIGWINKYIVINIFNTFAAWGLGYGLIIFLLALVIKIVLFPFTYKSYTSMAKMRLLKPQIDALNEKHEDPMKRQQATMALYRETGVNPMGGCIPMLFQMPILFALFKFLPSSIELRQQGFLWAEDLSTYDSIFDLPFSIPFYGDHVSLFTLLMTVTTVLQMRVSSNMQGTNAQMPQMKYMMYFMPVIFLGVMNNYAAALSYYYFLANLITFAQQKMIAGMVDDSSILAKMESNKTKPTKGKSKFQGRLEEMMKKQQEAQKKK